MSKHSIFMLAISTALTAGAGDRIITDTVTYKPELTLYEQIGCYTPKAKKTAENKHRTAHIYKILDDIRERNWVDLGGMQTLIRCKADLEVPITKQWGRRSETMTVLTKAIKQNLPYAVQLLIDNGAKVSTISLRAAYKQANQEMIRLLIPAIKEKPMYEYTPQNTELVEKLSPLDCILESHSINERSLRSCFIVLMYDARIDPYAPCQREDQQHGGPCHRCFALANPDDKDEKRKLTITEKAFVDALSSSTRKLTRKSLELVMPAKLAKIIGRYAF